jgi:hypothetical protein
MRKAHVEDREVAVTSLVADGAGERAFADTGRGADRPVVVRVDSRAAQQRFERNRCECPTWSLG